MLAYYLVYHSLFYYFFFFFFFQAEDGIRDFHVTGVQTCALPILPDATLKIPEILWLASIARMYAVAASWMPRIGLQMEGLLMTMVRSFMALLNIVLMMRSKRIRGLWPEIVPLRSEMTEKPSSASCSAACSP